MGERGGNGVLKVVDAIAAVLASIAIVDPGVRVLMHEQRNADRGEVSVAVIAITIAPQRVPRRRWNRMSWRSDREYVENRVFAVSVPTRFEKTGLGFPAVRQEQGIAVEHPAKVDTVVDVCCKPNDLGVGSEALAHGENTCE